MFLFDVQSSTGYCSGTSSLELQNKEAMRIESKSSEAVHDFMHNVTASVTVSLLNAHGQGRATLQLVVTALEFLINPLIDLALLDTKLRTLQKNMQKITLIDNYQPNIVTVFLC